MQGGHYYVIASAYASRSLTEPTDWAVADAMENLLSSPPTDV